MPSLKRLQRLAASGISKTSQEAERQLQLTKLRLELGELEARRRQALVELGDAVHRYAAAGELPEDLRKMWQDHLARLDALERQEEARRREIDALRRGERLGPRTCEACGARVPTDARFCPNCGTLLP
jgi:RNA polymerase-binding transcription factor DksA